MEVRAPQDGAPGEYASHLSRNCGWQLHLLPNRRQHRVGLLISHGDQEGEQLALYDDILLGRARAPYLHVAGGTWAGHDHTPLLRAASGVGLLLGAGDWAEHHGKLERACHDLGSHVVDVHLAILPHVPHSRSPWRLIVHATLGK
eukprot:4236962-Lingulodinium_polyedra.AAC.1